MPPDEGRRVPVLVQPGDQAPPPSEAAGARLTAGAAGVPTGPIAADVPTGPIAADVPTGPTAAAVPTGPAAAAADAYLRARRLEGRVFPDDVVARLPNLPVSHPLYTEWRLRGESAERLAAYLGLRPRPQRVLDVGCGNGWLANRIAQLDDTNVTGLDVNAVELDQAARVFGGRPNLRFATGDVTTIAQPAEPIDVIVLATVIQYVADLPALLRRLRGWLADGGEIHILDSPFYGAEALAGARDRSRHYYAGLGVPEMAMAYHHHQLEELAEFAPRTLYSPDTWPARLQRRLLARSGSPFPWLRIGRDAPR